jgi:hypothetical protein
MRAHTFPVRVGGRGRMKRRIVAGGILALSLAVVLLAPRRAPPARRGTSLRGTARPTDDPVADGNEYGAFLVRRRA